MNVQEFISLSKGAKMPDEKFRNKKYLNQDWEYPIQDSMNGILKIRYYTGQARGWTWTNCLMKHCKNCSEPIIVLGKAKANMSDSFCNKECKFAYTHPRLEPIEYNDKLYTLKDCNLTDMKRLNPIKYHVNQLKARKRRSKDLDYMKKDRAKRAKNAREKRRLNPMTEEERLKVNKANNERYHKNPQKFLYQQKQRIKNLTPEQKANARKVKNKWGREDRIKNYGKYLTQMIINTILRNSKVGKIKPISKYGLNVRKIRKHLDDLAIKMGYKDCYDIKQAGYDVDHIIPKKFYNLNKESEILKCNSIHNLRWLTSFENRSRGCKIRECDARIIKELPSSIYPNSWKGIVNEKSKN